MRSNRSISKNTFGELAEKNVKNSARDYLIYFITLMISVALFYSFNSISTQFEALGMLDRLSYLSFTSSVFFAVSLLVCFIIGKLVVYVNRFMLKRRKKEIGIYYTLGIENRDLNRMLLREALIIGAASLILGLGLGIVCSQGLTVLTGRLTGIEFGAFRFMISVKSVILSVLFFLILFIFVYRLNKREIENMTLLELLSSERKNETQPKYSGILGGIGFVAGLAMAAAGYWIVLTKSGEEILFSIGSSVAVLIGSTFLLILSISGIMVAMMKGNQFFYYKKLNPFVVSQIGSHMKNEAKSLALTGSLLFLALTMPSVGLGLGRYNVKDLDMLAPCDATIYVYESAGTTPLEDPMAELTKKGFRIEDYAKDWAALTLYSQNGQKIIGIDDYNRALVLQGKAPISLGAHEFAVYYNAEGAQEGLKRFEQLQDVTVAGTALTLASGGFYRNNIAVTNVLMDQATFIVPQYVTKGLTKEGWLLNLQFKGDPQEMLVAFTDIETLFKIPQSFFVETKDDAIMSVTSANIIFTYLGVYLGIVFLITSGVVLALQQLAQFTDNKKRYELLEKLGAGKRNMRHCVLTQLKIYFGIPFVLALVHSSVVICGVFQHLMELGGNTLAMMFGICLAVLSVIYSIYFLAAYGGSKRILKL